MSILINWVWQVFSTCPIAGQEALRYPHARLETYLMSIAARET